MSTATVDEIYAHLLVSIPNNLNTIPLVETAIANASSKISNADNRRMKWEFLIRQDVFKHAVQEGRALSDDTEKEAYYSTLCSWLDLALLFTELGATDASYTFSVIQDLLEMQTIPSCERVFEWISERSEEGRLTDGMVPQKGKALILLRTLNDLLRRLSKAGGETIAFSGRILTFLSQVFPLGERSGVNLRGDYGPTWEMSAGNEDDFYHTFWSLQLPFSKPSVFALQGMSFAQFQDAVDRVLPVIKEATAKERAMMGVGRSTGVAPTTTPITSGFKRKRGASRNDDIAQTGHEMEYFFAKFLTSPELLELEIADTHFRRQILFQLLILLTHLLNFTKAVKPTWMVSKNRSLHMHPMGEWSLDDALLATGAAAGAAGKDEPKASVMATPTKEKETKVDKDKDKDAIPKFVSASENAKTSSSTASPVNHSTSTTTSADADKPERLDPIRWTHLTISRAMEELRQTQPPPTSSTGVIGSSGLNGRNFAETVQALLEREKGWIKWKSELCDAKVFERERWEPEDSDQDVTMMGSDSKKRKLTTMYDATRSLRLKAQEDCQESKEWQWNLGTEALTEIWAMGYRGLDDLERGFNPGSPRDFLRQLDLEDKKIEMRTRALRAQQEKRAQLERAREAREKEFKEKEAKAIADAASTTVKTETEGESESRKGDSDVEMKPAPTAQAEDIDMKPPVDEASVKTEPQQPQPIPVHISGHPSLPRKPGSASPAPPAPTIGSISTTVVSAPESPSGTITKTAAPSQLPSLPPDEQIRKAEESKNRISWLALRTARDSTQGHLVHFSKIGTGDVKMLVEEIERAEREKEKAEADAQSVKEKEKEKMEVDQVETEKDMEDATR